jgi:hypothetical protein
MRLLAKFNLVLIVVFGVGINLACYIAHQFLYQNARNEVVNQARLMMSAAGAMHSYTKSAITW